jgi:hypothetical protein
MGHAANSSVLRGQLCQTAPDSDVRRAFPLVPQASGTSTIPYKAEQVLETSSSSSRSGMAAMCSITAMPAYHFVSTEELRFEDYTNGNKFGSSVALPGPQFPPAQQYFFSSSTAAANAGSNVAAPGPQVSAAQPFIFGSSTAAANAGNNVAQQYAFGSSAAAQQYIFGSSTAAAQPAYQTTLVQERSSDDGSTCMVAMFTVAAMPSYVHMSTEELRFENYQAGKKSAAAAVKPATPSLPDVPSSITAQHNYRHLSTEELRYQNYQSGMTSGLVAAAAAAPAAPVVAIAAPSCSTPTRSTAALSDAAAAAALRSPNATMLEIKYPPTWQPMNSCSESIHNWLML